MVEKLRPGRLVVEDSRALRGLALAAMVTGAAAVAWAGNIWLPWVLAVIAMTSGALYSYVTRDEPAGAVGRWVLVALMGGAFCWMVADLATAFAGGMLPQAQFGMASQAITSFRLRTRRDLWATLVHSLLLLYIACDVAYRPLLLLFLAVFATCTLAFLAVASMEDGQRASGSSRSDLRPLLHAWRVLLPAALLGLAASLMFFVGMPRFGSNQVISTATASLPFPTGVRGQTVTPVFPFISLTSTGQSGPSPTMDLSFRGRPSYEVVLYVRSQVRSHWRGLSFDTYDGRAWQSTSRVRPTRRGARGGFPLQVPPAAEAESQYVQTFSVVKDQPDAVFTGYWAELVQYPDTGMLRRVDGGGDAMLAREPLRAGTTYNVVSRKPANDPAGLDRDTAQHADQRFTALPAISPRVRALAREVAGAAGSDYGRALALEDYLRREYAYDLDLPPLREGREAVDTFLFQDRRGFCQQFATAMAVMARALGLPARVVTGYLPGQYDPIVGAFVVRAADAHSWVEVHFSDHGWVAFDPTPEVGGDAREQAAMTWLVGSWQGPAWSDVGLAVESGAAALAGDLSGIAGVLGAPTAIALAAVLVPLALFAVFRARRPRFSWLRDRRRLTPRALLLQQYQDLDAALGRAGVAPRNPWETPREHLNRAGERIVDEAVVLRMLGDVITEAVYAEHRPSEESAGAFARSAASLKRRLQGR